VPFVSWPIFQGGRLRAGLEGADARARVAALSYEKAVLTALADAESAISAYTEELQTHENLSAAADASREAAEIAQKLYEKGLADFLTVLDAERRRDENEDARAQSHTRLLLNLVRVYKSLGGGWAMNSGSA
jgi:outer membrane protein TolC